MHTRNLLLCFLVGVLCHIVTVPVPLQPTVLFGRYSIPNTTYVYDDVVAIEKNPFVYDARTDWQELFTTRDFWGNVLAWASSHKSYRPITSLTYRVQVLWDGSGIRSTSVKQSLHAFNVLLFGVVCACFYHVCAKLAQAAHLKGPLNSPSAQHNTHSARTAADAAADAAAAAAAAADAAAVAADAAAAAVCQVQNKLQSAFVHPVEMSENFARTHKTM